MFYGIQWYYYVSVAKYYVLNSNFDVFSIPKYNIGCSLYYWKYLFYKFCVDGCYDYTKWVLYEESYTQKLTSKTPMSDKDLIEWILDGKQEFNRYKYELRR